MEALTPAVVGWIITGVAGLFVIFGLIWGLIRGFKKTGFRAAWIVVTALVMFLLTPVISNALFSINFSGLGINMGGVQFTTITETVQQFISQNPQVSQIVADNPVLLEVILKLPQIVLNVVIFLLGFWLLKILLWPVWAIIAHSVFKKKKPDGTVIKKNRWGGALLGTVVGLFIAVITFMPLIGAMDMITTIEVETTGLDFNIGLTSSQNDELVLDDLAEGQTSSLDVLQVDEPAQHGIITQLVGEEVMSYINGYNNSLIANVFKYTGMQEVGKIAFNSLTTVEINNRSVNLQSEIYNVINIAKIVDEIKEIDFENLTQADLDLIFDNAEALVDYAFNSEIIQAVGDEIFPYFFDELNNNPDFIIQKPETGNEHLDYLIDVALNELSKINMDYIKNEIKCIARAGKVLNDSGVIYAIYENASDYETALDLITDQVIDDFVEEIFDMRIVSVIGPVAIDAGLRIAAESLEIEDFQLSDAPLTAEQLEDTVSELLKHSLNLYKSIDFESDYYVTAQSFDEVGAILDTIIDFPLFIVEDENVVIALAQQKAVEYLDGAELPSEIPAEFIFDLKLVIYNIDDISSFSVEFGHIGDAFTQVIGTVEKFIENGLDADLTDDDLYNIGYVIETIENLRLLGAYNYDGVTGSNLFRRVLAEALDYAELEIDMPELANVFASLNDNISVDIDWTEEILVFKPVIDVGMHYDELIMDYIMDETLCDLTYNYINVEIGTSDLSELIDLFGNVYDDSEFNAVTGNGTIVWTFNFGSETLEISSILTNNIVTSIQKTGPICVVDFGNIVDQMKQSALIGNVLNDAGVALIDIVSDKMITIYTYEDYEQIQNGQTYEELVDLLGEPSVLSEFNPETKTGIVEWSKSSVVIRVTFVSDAVTDKENVGLSVLNELAFNEVFVGETTYTDAIELFGTELVTGGTYAGGDGTKIWTDGSISITLTFEDDVVISKSQVGLNPSDINYLMAYLITMARDNLEAASELNWTDESYYICKFIGYVMQDATDVQNAYSSISAGSTTLAQAIALLGDEYDDTEFDSVTGDGIIIWELKNLVITLELDNNLVSSKRSDYNVFKLFEIIVSIDNSQIIDNNVKESLIQIFYSMLLPELDSAEVVDVMNQIIDNIISADPSTVAESLREFVLLFNDAYYGELEEASVALEAMEDNELVGFELARDMFLAIIEPMQEELNDELLDLQAQYAAETDPTAKAALQTAINELTGIIEDVDEQVGFITSAANSSETNYVSVCEAIYNAINGID